MARRGAQRERHAQIEEKEEDVFSGEAIRRASPRSRRRSVCSAPARRRAPSCLEIATTLLREICARRQRGSAGCRGSIMFTYLIVVAISAFVPYVATPAAEAGVKTIVSHHNDMETSDAAATPTLVAQEAPIANAQPREAH
jgi:hypothetical protein